jgi:hypothetical protein
MVCIRIVKLILSSPLFLVLIPAILASPVANDSYQTWTLSEALGILNNSSWARQETYTQVIGGIGSGIQGEKEIYNTFFVRFLSAAPIREAYARVKQIHLGYDKLKETEQQRISEEIKQGLELDVSQWIIVAVTFRSNNLDQQSRVERFFRSQTAETVRTRVFLSTDRFPKLHPLAYYPPKEESVGAKFVFPRNVDSIPVITADDEMVVFELDVIDMAHDLRAIFSVQEMIVDGVLVI